MKILVSLWQHRNYRVAAIVALLALLWLASGLLFSPSGEDDAARETGAESDTGGEPLRVRARLLEARPYTSRALVNAHTEANRSVRLKAEQDGAIIALPVAEGRSVRKGDVICEIDPEDRPEQLERARAALRKAELDFEGGRRLEQKGLQSDTAMAERKLALADARAELERARLAVEKLKIRAPFDGVVNRRAVELGDFIRRGEECATLLDLDPLLVVGEVSETRVGDLTLGGPASAELQRGRRVTGSLRYISHQASDTTRAYRVEVAVENPHGELRGGISGRLALPTGEVMAHRINSSLLTLDDRGELGVRILDGENRVRFANVELVGEGDDGIRVSGLPDPVTLITVGQEYVSTGETVVAEMEAPARELSPPEDAVAQPALEKVRFPGKGETP